ncbi:MAG: DUF2339 domain-containing protein [Mycobacterium sp.]
MTESHSAVIGRLSAEFASMSEQMAKLSADLNGLDRVLATVVDPNVAPVHTPTQVPPPYWPYPYAQQPYGQRAPTGGWPAQGWQQPSRAAAPAAPAQATAPQAPAPQYGARPLPPDTNWIGKVLAVAGVGVTLIGVVLLVVLAAQAGILRPEIRVLAGAGLAGALVVLAGRLCSRPGGRTGAVALAATGVAAAYIDVIAVTRIYAWVTEPLGLLVAALIGGGGLLLARRWDAEMLGLLVLVPLIVLAPVVTDGVTMLLVGFMLVLAAATLPFQLGKNWTWLHAARVAAPTLPLLLATFTTQLGPGTDLWLLGASYLIAALVAVVAALVLLPSTMNRGAVASITALGTLPVLAAPAALPPLAAAALCAALAACLLGVVLVGRRLPGVSGIVVHVWSALAAVAAIIGVLAAFDGDVSAAVLLAIAIPLAVAGRRSGVARWASVGFVVVGGLIFLAYAPPFLLVEPWEIPGTEGASILISSVLLVAVAAVTFWMWAVRDNSRDEATKVMGAVAVATIVYAVTTFTITAGILAGGLDGGFVAGHMAATIGWIAMAAALFGYAAWHSTRGRSLPIAGGLALTVAAMAKLFLFDLGNLDGIFRVVVFIVVGLVLLGMGAGYARHLAQQDQVRQDGDRQGPREAPPGNAGPADQVRESQDRACLADRPAIPPSRGLAD